jgi:hypothetical protein
MKLEEFGTEGADGDVSARGAGAERRRSGRISIKWLVWTIGLPQAGVEELDRIDGAFAALLGISQLLYIAVVLTLGVRLLLLALRSRQLPESLLAVHFLLCCGLGYLLMVIGLTAANEPGMLPAAVVTGLIAVGTFGSCVGVFGGICFNFLVFRQNEPWARGLVALCAVTLTTGFIGYGLTGGFAHGHFAGPWFWLYYGTYAVGAAWVMAEPLRYYGVIRKRLQLGLAEPLVANRFLLWGIGSVGRFVMVVGGAVPSVFFAGTRADFAPGAVSFILIGVGLVGLVVAVSYWLTFFPTRRYVRFIERRHETVES